MRKLLFALLSFLLIKLSHEVHDESFVKFCTNVRGSYMKSTSEWDSGDECKVIWPIPSSSNSEAKRYCKNWGAYPVKHSRKSDNGQTECVYENVLECRNDYTLINGECYRFVEQNKFVNYKDAVKLCEKEKFKTKDLKPITYKPKVIRFFDKSLIRWFKAYFTNLRSIFVLQDAQLSQIISKDLGGSNFAIVYGMSVHYKSPPNSLVKLPKNAQAQVMCSYKPVNTVLSFGYKAKMIAPYYYPIGTKGIVTAWRTSSHSSYLKSTVPEAKICEASLKAIVGDTKAEAFDPREENTKPFSADFRNGFVISRAAVIRCCYSKDGNNYKIAGQVFRGKCKSHDYVIQHVVDREDSQHNCAELPSVDENYYKINTLPHDFNKNVETTILFTAGNVDGKYDIVSRQVAVEAPLFCSLYIPQPDRATEKDCPTGYTGITRTGTLQTVCHRWINTWNTYEEAIEYCKKHGGGELSTFTDQRELDLINRLNQVNNNFWIGLAIKKECDRVDENRDGQCSKRNLWKFTGSITRDTKIARDFVGTRWSNGEPNNWRNSQEACIELQTNGLMNDQSCSSKRLTSCMVAPKKEKATEADCEPGWHPYTRKLSNGETVVMCHFMSNIWGNYWKVEKGCKEEFDGAILSTFTTEKEYQLLQKLINNRHDQWSGYQFFIGYYKTPECHWANVRRSNQNGCTLENCFYDYEPGTEITPAVRKLVASKFKLTEPDGSGQALSVYRGVIWDEFSAGKTEKQEGYAMCMKKAQKK